MRFPSYGFLEQGPALLDRFRIEMWVLQLFSLFAVYSFSVFCTGLITLDYVSDGLAVRRLAWCLCPQLSWSNSLPAN